MVLTKQMEKAAKAVKEAEAVLTESQAPLALAQCDELIGRFYDGDRRELWRSSGTLKQSDGTKKRLTAHPDDLVDRASSHRVFSTDEPDGPG